MRMEDTKEFETRNDYYFDKVFLIRFFVLGFRRYLLKENDASMAKCRVNYRRLVVINVILKFVLCLAGFFLIYFLILSKYNLINYLKAQLRM